MPPALVWVRFVVSVLRSPGAILQCSLFMFSDRILWESFISKTGEEIAKQTEECTSWKAFYVQFLLSLLPSLSFALLVRENQLFYLANSLEKDHKKLSFVRHSKSLGNFVVTFPLVFAM